MESGRETDASENAVRIEAPAAKPKMALLVASMHRSGTSALTRVVNLLGYEGARSIMRADRFNERGYWESEGITSINDAILEFCGAAWDSWEPLSSSWSATPKYQWFRERALEVLTDQFGQSAMFVLKDPRISRLLPFWQGVLADFGAEARIAVPIRNPEEIASSLLRRNGTNMSVSQLVWLRYMLDVERDSRNSTRIFLSYADLLRNWREPVARMERQLHISWPRLSTPSSIEIDTFLSPALRHDNLDHSGSLNSTSYSPWVREVYDVLMRWAAGGETKDDRNALDEIRRQFDSAAPNFVRPMHEQNEHGSGLVARLNTTERELARHVSSNAGHRQHIDDLRAHMKRLEDDSRVRQASIVKLEADLQLTNRMRRELQSVLRAVTEDLASRTALLDSACAELGANPDQLPLALNAVSRRVAELEQLRDRDLASFCGRARLFLARHPRLTRYALWLIRPRALKRQASL